MTIRRSIWVVRGSRGYGGDRFRFNERRRRIVFDLCFSRRFLRVKPILTDSSRSYAALSSVPHRRNAAREYVY